MNDNMSLLKINFYDFLSLPNNPEELFTLLYIIEKKSNYEIYKAIHNESREIFSIKIIPLDNETSYLNLKEESLIMNSLKNCDNIIKYYGSYFSFKSKNIWLIFEYCPPGSIYDLLNIIERPLIEQEISIIINDILNAMIYMHQLNIVHGHVKLTNILLTEKAVAKIGNFSKANQLLNNSYKLTSKKSLDEKRDIKYDIFLLGIICIELFKGNNDTFNRNNFINSIKKNKNINSDSSIKLIEKNFFSGKEQLCSKDFIDFVKKCLEINSYLRPSAFELKNHPFIKNNSNPTNSEKLYFSNLIRFNIEKIEYQKKEKNYISNNSLKKSNLNNTNNSLKKSNVNLNNTNNSIKKSINNNTDKNLNSFYGYNFSIYSTKTKNSNLNTNEKHSVNISNMTKDKNNENNTINVDKLAEFRMEQLKNDVQVDFDRYTSKDVLVDKSNLDNNTEYHYGTDISFDKSLKASAVFGKGDLEKENKNNNKTYIKKKDSSFIKNIINIEGNKNTITNKKEENFIKKDNSFNNITISDNGKNPIKKESDEIDYFKDNWEHLNKYKDIFKERMSGNNINYNYNNSFLNLNSDDSFDLNNNIKNNLKNNINTSNKNTLSKLNSSSINDSNYFNIKSINNNIPFSEMKCNVIQLGNSVKKNTTSRKSNYTSEYSLKNSIFKVNDNTVFSLKNSLNKTNENLINFNKNNSNGSNSQRLLLSFKNNIINDININLKKNFIKEKNYNNEISSTCFTSLNSPINKMRDAMGIVSQVHNSCSPFFSVRQKNFEENKYNVIKGKKYEKKKRTNNMKKSSSEYKKGLGKNNENIVLYKYIKEMESKNKTDVKTKTRKKKNNIIKIEKLFIKKNNNKIDSKKNIQNIVINNKN